MRADRRLEFLGVLQQSAMHLRRLARGRPSPIAAELLSMADEIATEAAALEGDLLDAGLLDAGLTRARAANQN